jgi:hypothetical protein
MPQKMEDEDEGEDMDHRLEYVSAPNVTRPT